MKSFCIELLQACSIEDAVLLVGASWDAMHNVQERAVKRGLARRGDALPKVIGLSNVRMPWRELRK